MKKVVYTTILAAIAAVFCAGALLAAGCAKKDDTGGQAGSPASSDEESGSNIGSSQGDGGGKAANAAVTTMFTYNGREITSEEFRLFTLMSNGAGEDDVLDYMLYALAVIEHAKDSGISPDDEALATIESDIDLLDDYTSDTDEHDAYFDPFAIPRDKLTDWLATDYYSQRLYELYTDDIEDVTDDADFGAELDKYYETGRRYYTELLFKYIYTDSDEETEDAKAFIDGGGDFDEAVKQFSEDYSQEEGIAEMDLRQINMDEDWANKLLDSKVGDVLGPFDFGDGGFVIIQVVMNNRPTKADIEENFREQYIDELKRTRFDELVGDWRDEANWVINDEALASFEMH